MMRKNLITIRNLVRFLTISLIALLPINCLANTKTVATPTFSINLPKDMQQALRNEDRKVNIYQYVFSSMPNSYYAPKQLRITSVAKVPKNEKDYADWELQALVATMTFFTEAYHLNLAGQTNVLSKKPDTVVLGKQTFTSVTMIFNDNIQVKFLVTIEKNLTYIFTLMSINNDKTIREANMNTLIDSVKTVKYLGLGT